MTRNRKRTHKKPIPIIKTNSKASKSSIAIKRQKYPVRRYEAYHEKFLNNKGIKDFLMKLQKAYPSSIQVQVIGQSTEGRPIYLTVISDGVSSNPKMGAMIVGGSNGTEWFTVSSALYMIEQLVKGKTLTKIMDYFIIPCCNPDAYEFSLENKGKDVKALDLSTNFPFSLGIYDLSAIPNETFYKAIREWKESFKFNCPERVAVLQTIVNYQVAVKLFINLQGNGTKITYPFGCYGASTYDVEAMKKVAKAGQSGIKSRCFAVGSMYDLSGMCFGAMVDYIRMCQSSIKFVYAIHVNKKEKELNPCHILAYGQDMMNCVRFMARNVYMLYNKSAKINSCDDFFTFISILVGDVILKVLKIQLHLLSLRKGGNIYFLIFVFIE